MIARSTCRGPSGPSRAALPLAAALALLAATAVDAQESDPRGRYDFATTSAEGSRFTGTIHIAATTAGYGGRVFSTLRGPMRVDSVARAGDAFRAVLDGGRPGARIEFEWTLRGDSLTGQWTGFGTSRRLEGARHELDEDGNLPPVPCLVVGGRGVAKCAVYHVWEDRKARSGRRIPLNIVILPALAADPELDPLVHFAGGPGQASTDQSSANQARFAAINRRRDVVMIDQRGTGASNGLRCELGAQSLLTWQFAIDEVKECRARLEERADLRHYHSANAADDVDEVRAWLGYPRLNLYGGSYGTRVALAYLHRHPDRVRTATVRGVMPPPGSFPINVARDAQSSLDILFARCAEDPACGRAYPDLRARLGDALGRLDTGPVTVRLQDPVTGSPIDHPIGRDAFAWGVRRVLLGTDQYPSLPSIIDRAAEGDLSGLQPGFAGTLALAPNMFLGMSLSVTCSDDGAGLAAAAIDYETEATFIGGGPSRAFRALCEVWPHTDLPAAALGPARSEAPVLLLSGELDPTTPPRWGELAARTLPNSRHVVMPGASHGPFPACGLRIMSAFVESGATRGLVTACASDISVAPFVPTPP